MKYTNDQFLLITYTRLYLIRGWGNGVHVRTELRGTLVHAIAIAIAYIDRVRLYVVVVVQVMLGTYSIVTIIFIYKLTLCCCLQVMIL